MKKGFLTAGAEKVKAASVVKDTRSEPLQDCAANSLALLDSTRVLLASPHYVSAALRVASCALELLESQSLSEARSQLNVCERRETEITDQAMALIGSRSPIDALRQILRHGVEGGIWEKLHRALQESLGRFGTMLEEVGLLSSESLLQHTHHQQPNTNQIYVFAPRREVGGIWVNVPCSTDAASFAARAVGISAAQHAGTFDTQDAYKSTAGDSTHSTLQTATLWKVVQGAAWPQGGVVLDKVKWSALCNGDWVETVEIAEEPEENHSQNISWPSKRCAREFLHGALPRRTQHIAYIVSTVCPDMC